MLINFYFSRNLKQAKRKRICSTENKQRKKATLHWPLELNLKGVILTGNTLCYAVIMAMLKPSADCMALH